MAVGAGADVAVAAGGDVAGTSVASGDSELQAAKTITVRSDVSTTVSVLIALISFSSVKLSIPMLRMLLPQPSRRITSKRDLFHNWNGVVTPHEMVRAVGGNHVSL